MRKLFVLLVLIALAASACSADGLVRRSRRSRRSAKAAKAKQLCADSYPEPERSWIKSGQWRMIGDEFDREYHTQCCPLMQAHDPRRLLGWRSADEARNVGRTPCKVCKPTDPKATPQGKLRELFEKSSSALAMRDQVGALGFISQAADYHQVAFIARGDAFMIAADMEKARGRLDNARSLYREAANAYSSATNFLPPVPAPGGTLAQTSGMNVPSGVASSMAGGMGGGYDLGGVSIVSGAAGGIAF